MKNLTFPIKIHSGLKPIITQHYGVKDNVSWYVANNVNIPFHNGCDLILSGDPMQTYGSELITPSENWRIVKTTFDSAMSTKGNGVTIESESFIEDGIEKKLQVVYWHCSKIETSPHIRPKNDTVAWIGNSGLVSPAPSPVCIYCGSHLHLMLFEFHKENGWWRLQNQDNGVGGAIDPMTRFSISNLVYGEDTNISFDTEPIKWALKTLGITDVWGKIVFILKTFKTK